MMQVILHGANFYVSEERTDNGLDDACRSQRGYHPDNTL